MRQVAWFSLILMLYEVPGKETNPANMLRSGWGPLLFVHTSMRWHTLSNCPYRGDVITLKLFGPQINLRSPPVSHQPSRVKELYDAPRIALRRDWRCWRLGYYLTESEPGGNLGRGGLENAILERRGSVALSCLAGASFFCLDPTGGLGARCNALTSSPPTFYLSAFWDTHIRC